MARQQKRQRTVVDDWPLIARAFGILIGMSQAVAALIAGPSDVSAEVLVFAGSLIVAPAIVGAQERRNGKRGEDE
jgi:hypothetical protein